jgi:hypothetical protein
MQYKNKFQSLPFFLWLVACYWYLAIVAAIPLAYVNQQHPATSNFSAFSLKKICETE